MDADASASFDLDADALSAGLDGIAAKFEAVAATINASFANANAQLARTAGSAQMLGAAAAPSNTVAVALVNAANAGRLVATAFAGIVTTAARLAPFVKYLPDSVGAWAPKVKAVAAEYTALVAKVSLVTKAAAALSGRLSVLSAGFAVLELRELGASKAAAVFGAAGALAMSKTIAGARAATVAVAGLTVGLARAASAGFAGAFAGIGRSLSTVAMVVAPVAGLALALGPVGAAALGVAGAFSAVGKSISSAGEVQSLQMSFVTLLGSATAAQQRMSELSRFAATTPFDIPGVTKASRVLQTLTGGALATGAGLRLVGDAAAVSQQPFEQLAVHIGRLYDGLMNGRPVGEALMRLQELGLVTSNTRARIEALQKEGAKGGEVWAVAAGDLQRFSGEMQRQSGTWGGLLSNVSDSVGNLFRAFGAPVITALTPFMQRLIGWLGNLTAWAEKAGSIFAGWSALIAQIFADGKITEALALAGKVAFLEATNALLGGLTGAGSVLLTVVGGAARAFVSLLSAATTADFWKGLGNALKAAAAALLAMLSEGVAKVLDAMRNVPKIGAAAGRAADTMRDFSTRAAGAALDAGAAAGNNLAPLFDRWGDDFRATMSKAAEAFTEGRAAGGSLIDTASAREELARFIRPFAERAQKAVSAAAAVSAQGGLPPPIAGTVEPTSSGKGKAGNDVASLQRIGGGGGFSISRADPLLAESRNQTSELKGVRGEIKQLRDALTSRRPGASEPVFS